MIEGVVLTVSFIGTLLIGLLVFLNNPKSATNRVFALLAVTMAVWPVFNYFSLNGPSVDVQLVFVRLVIATVIILSLSYYLLAIIYPRTKVSLFRRNHIEIALSIILMGTAMTPFIFKSASYKGDSFSPDPNFGIILFGAQLAYFLIGSIFILTKRYRKSTGIERSQLKILVYGSAIMITLSIFFNFILAVVFRQTQFVAFGPLYTLIFTVFIGYAILKHKMFDIKFVVARLFAYTLMLSSLVGIYSLIVFFLANMVLGAGTLFAQQIIPIITALFLVFTAPFLKRLFDKITNAIFYQDSYDPQVFLDQFNKALLDNIEVQVLLRHVTTVIKENIKCQFCTIVVNTEGPKQTRIVGTRDLDLSKDDIATLRQGLARQGVKIINTESFSFKSSHFTDLLKSKNISIVSRFDTRYRTGENSLAYLILGPKQSGNLYNNNDLRIIEIISDELIIAVQNALRFEEIQGFAATLQARINKATAKLKKTNQKLKDLDETKDEFISMASHQLRTPLTSVKGYLSMVLDEDTGKINKKQRDLLEPAFMSAQRMVYLIADLLNVSRLKSGKFVLIPAPANILDIVSSEIQQLKTTLNAKKISLHYKKPKHVTNLLLDETKLRQVVMNFIDNAIYYTPEGGKIEVEIKEDKNNIYFIVRDNGIGIPKEEQRHLFTKFYRTEGARKMRPDGTGLGLFMAKKVVDAHKGGNIIFDSQEGKGSTFGFCFNKSKLKIK